MNVSEFLSALNKEISDHGWDNVKDLPVYACVKVDATTRGSPNGVTTIVYTHAPIETLSAPHGSNHGPPKEFLILATRNLST